MVSPGDNDIISNFLELTEGISSPELFRLWSAISLVAGALERRVWVDTKRGVIHPNLYTLLVAPPGVGKFIINTVRELWSETLIPDSKLLAYKVAPDNMTKAALIDRLAKSKQILLTTKGPTIEYHSLLVAAEEFGVLLPGWDNEFIGTLNSIYNNPTVPFSEERRHGLAKEVSIPLPCLNILGGAQPLWLGLTMPEEAWGMGLMSRIIMIYSSEGKQQSIFYEGEVNHTIRKSLLKRLGKLSILHGSIQFTDEAKDYFENWWDGGKGGKPVPEHSKLANYRNRRPVHAVKLAMISSLARSDDMTISLWDIRRALSWMFRAERIMPDVFRDMIGKSDSQVIEEMHFYLTSLWAKSKGQPIPESQLINFLRQRVPADKFEKILVIAERSNVISRVAGTTTYLPRPKIQHGVE